MKGGILRYRLAAHYKYSEELNWLLNSQCTRYLIADSYSVRAYRIGHGNRDGANGGIQAGGE